jgi:N-acetylglucosaminyldiphosphoundecaprenol N-acetyl-beta-D-mannosaminyltransferase
MTPQNDNGRPFKTTRILDIPISNLGYDGVVDQIINWGLAGEHRYVGVCNVHSTTSSAWTPGLREALTEADMNTADGMPLVWMQRFLGHAGASRVYGPTLMLETLKKAVRKNLRIAFYGGHPDRLPVLLEKLQKAFPGLNVVEAISPPFRELTEEEDADYTRRLNEAKPHIIWVGIGCPKQERWMHAHRAKIRGVMVGVGAAFDFHAGVVPQAPAILQKAGLEWAYRLYCEPRRLIKRYLTTNPVFVARALGQLTRKVLLRKSYIRTARLSTPGINPAS